MKQQTHYDAARNKAFTLLSLFQARLNLSWRYLGDIRLTSDLLIHSDRCWVGFKNRVYRAGFNESENIVNILSENSDFIEVDIINGSYVNGKLNPIIYTFF
jgi:hypothetical protein